MTATQRTNSTLLALLKFCVIGSLMFWMGSCASVQAMPPLHKNFALTCTLPTTGAPVTAANFYKAQLNDTNWTSAGAVVATNGQTVTVAYDPAYALHTADSSNSVTGQSSDFAEVLTNPVPVSPGLKIK